LTSDSSSLSSGLCSEKLSLLEEEKEIFNAAFYIYLFILVTLGFELRASGMLGRGSTT
jgi:hypothetical protein